MHDKLNNAVREHNVPLQLVAGRDPTSPQLMPSRQHTMMEKGAQSAATVGAEDKRRVTPRHLPTPAGAPGPPAPPGVLTARPPGPSR